MIAGTAGHIDHGKTALVRCLPGVATDRLPEEKRRGITIELGFASLDVPGVGVVGVVDVPGHEAFVRTMVAGATGVDLGLLVVAADEGVMPQTREHLTILSLLAVRAGIVVITKSDLAEREWIELVKDEIRDLARGTALHDAPIVVTSVKTGEGIETLRTEIARQLMRLGSLEADDLFRLPIDRAFSVKGTGTVVTGTSWTGRLAVGTELHLYPLDRAVRVRALQVHGKAAMDAGAGTRIAVALAGVEVAEVARGSMLVTPGSWVPATRFHAVVTLEAGAIDLRAREWLLLGHGTSEVSARVVPIPGLGAGRTTVVRVVTQVPLVLRAGDRFILRRSQPLATIGGGRVLDPAPVRRRGRPTGGWVADPMDRLVAAVALAGPAGLASVSLPIRVGIDLHTAKALLAAAPNLTNVDGAVYLTSLLGDVEERVVREVFTHHDVNQIDEGVPVSRLRSALGQFGHLVDHVLERLSAAGKLEVAGALVRRPGWKPILTGQVQTTKVRLAERIAAAALEPPSISELRGEIGVDVVPLLRMMEREGAIVAVESDRYFDAPALGGAVRTLARTMRDGTVFSPAQLREVLGMSRKYLMPLLEFCDRRRFTERRGDGRVWLPGAVVPDIWGGEGL